jgi:hypothetical protein
MSRSELTKVFYKLRKRTKSSEKLLSSTMSLTNGVTLYAAEFLGTYNNSESDFRRFEIQLMKKDWEVLYGQVNDKTACFGLESVNLLHDRKHFISTRSSGKNKVLPLIPIVRDFF